MGKVDLKGKGEEERLVQWYLLKTWAGREEELVQKIRRTVPASAYQECFVIYQERIWRKQQKSIVHVEPLFPGCVFLTGEPVYGTDCESAYGGLPILPVMEEDAQFLEKISGKEHLVKLSFVQKDEAGNIGRLSEPLNGCRAEIERMQFKKRYAMVRHRLWGEEKVLVLGILLNEDRGSKLLYKDGKNRLIAERAGNAAMDIEIEGLERSFDRGDGVE